MRLSSQPDPARRVTELVDRLNRYCHLYYVEGRSEISDEEYDQLYRELAGLEEAHPKLVSQASPTQRVGAPLPEGQGFEKVPHAVPMLSIESLFTRDEVSEFFEKIQRFLGLDAQEELDWQVEPKFDGVSASLIYERGHLARAERRGRIPGIGEAPVVPEDAVPPCDHPRCLCDVHREGVPDERALEKGCVGGTPHIDAPVAARDDAPPNSDTPESGVVDVDPGPSRRPDREAF